MFKKPLCPHCGAIYDHKEISDQKNNSVQVCRNCQKSFTVRKTGGRALLAAITFVSAVALNIFMLTVVRVRSVLPMLIVTIILISAALFLQPYFVKYEKEKKKDIRK